MKFYEKNIKNKVATAMILCVILAFIGPCLINEAYKYGTLQKNCYITLWGASDLLSYYGTILGATATILAVVWTINHSKKINRHNLGIKACFDLIESCEINKLYTIIEEIVILSSSIKGKELDKVMLNKIMNISTVMNLNYIKLQFIYPEMNDEEKDVFFQFLKPYSDLVLQVGIIRDKQPSENFHLEPESMKELEKMYTTGFAKFSENLQEFETVSKIV